MKCSNKSGVSAICKVQRKSGLHRKKTQYYGLTSLLWCTFQK